MEPENSRFGGGSAATLLHPLVAVALVVAIALIFFLPRKHVIIPLLLAIFLIPKGQVVVIGGAHFTAAKILFLTGMIRWFITRGSLTVPGGWNPIDRAFALWAFCYPLVFSLQWMQSQAVIKSIGDSVDNLCGYFVLRFLIKDAEDVRRVIRVFAGLSAVMALCMLNEQFTGQNIFGLLGGVRRIPDIRDGSIRASGVFQHSILAGCFGGTLLPLFVSLWTDQKSRLMAFVGIISATLIVGASKGSTPALAYVAGIFALTLWPCRRQMRFLRWGLALTLLGLHLVMNGPVWSLIEKVDMTGSSSSYHRYMLMDNCIRHFSTWWLLGCKEYDTWGFDMWDLSNQYVAYAVTGGVVTLVCFIAIIVRSFAAIGIARRRIAGDRKREWLYWCLGAALFAHVAAYLGIGYFDQMQFAWFALLAIISMTAFDIDIGSKTTCFRYCEPQWDELKSGTMA